MIRDRTSISHIKAVLSASQLRTLLSKRKTTPQGMNVCSGQNQEYKASEFSLLQCFIIFEAMALALKGTYFRKVKKFKSTW